MIKPGESVLYRFQNFYLSETKTYEGADYVFVPFGFSGVTINRTGDGLDASLVFPNNELSRVWIAEAVESRWIIEVDVLAFDPDTTNPSVNDRVHTYTGQVTGVVMTKHQSAGNAWDGVRCCWSGSTDACLDPKVGYNLPVTANVSLAVI